MAELADIIQKLIESKKPDECENIFCTNKQKYIVTVTYGVWEQNKKTFLLCPDCKDAEQKDCKSWGYIFKEDLIPGESEPVRIKKRGRPKN
jgi:hypothetical protein